MAGPPEHVDGGPAQPAIERDLGLRQPRPRIAAWLDRRWRPVDGLFNRIYTSEHNPLYKSGALAVTFLLLTIVTGIYLFLLYKIADPYGSVAALDATWHGSWMRSIHRYSADLAVVAVALHVLKMLLSGRTWGPRALAWITGVILLGLLLLCGWTGLVMAWDVQGQLVAIEGAELADLLPIFSEPLSRSFTHPESVGRAFFFMNLFLHVALPLGFAALFWLHSSRVARAPFFPPKTIHRYAIGAVAVLSLLVPVPLPPEADLLAVSVPVPLDVFYAFWLPLARSVSAPAHFLAWLVAAGIALSVPWWWRPRERGIRPSVVDESRCAGCTQCYHDCPYEAINMITREVPSDLSEIVARVNPEFCVGCGICSGSCAPMGVGPPARTGREQLRDAETFLRRYRPTGDDVVMVGCGHGLGADPGLAELGGLVFPSACSGSVHTSVIELFLRSGAGGVMVLTCPDRDCLYREGPKWLHERVYNDREAELQLRVDKRRVRLVNLAASELEAARSALESFRTELDQLGPVVAEHEVKLAFECEPVDV
jgi:coenzyme F420-reducing hydrogenase delta subunit/Pyruvate/2-oxoacid:ferredoxin oxidoreductase delta subunit